MFKFLFKLKFLGFVEAPVGVSILFVITFFTIKVVSISYIFSALTVFVRSFWLWTIYTSESLKAFNARQ